MKITAAFAALGEAAAKEDSRPVLTGVHITPDGRWAVAADGYMLAAMMLAEPAEEEYRNFSFFPKSLRALRTALRKGAAEVKPIDNDAVWAVTPAGRKVVDAGQTIGTFPGFAKQLRPGIKVVQTVAVDPKRLRQVCDIAIAANAYMLKLGIQEDPNKAILFAFTNEDTEHVRGALMPMYATSSIDWQDVVE